MLETLDVLVSPEGEGGGDDGNPLVLTSVED